MVKIVPEGDASALHQAVEVLNAGGVLCYPTDTTYALGVDARNPKALARLMELKGRDADKPISIAIATVDRLISEISSSDRVQTLLRRLLPGPLTVILRPAEPFQPPIANAQGLVGYRVPDNAFCCAMLSSLRFPVTATSANPGGQPAAIDIPTLTSLPNTFLDQIDLAIDGGKTREQQASTVMRLLDDGEVRIIRAGALPEARILALIGSCK